MMRSLILCVVLASTLLIEPVAQAHSVSLRDKIGQMLIIGFEGQEVHAESDIAKAIQEDNIGGVILFDYNQKTERFDKNISSPAQVKQLNHDLQALAQQANASQGRPNEPLLITIDYEGGKITRLQEQYGFPATLSAEKIGKKTLEEAATFVREMAYTLQDSGFNLDFAPSLDVNTNPDNPVIAKKERSFSSIPSRVAKFAALYSQQFQQHGIQCAYKHFPGHGSSTNDSHLGFVDVTQTWQSQELYPYQALLNQPYSCKVVMTAHIVNRQLDESGLPATLSYRILTDLLRGHLHFSGVIITDDMQMKAISDHYGLAEALTMAVNAGADMFIFGNQLTQTPVNSKKIIDIIESKVNSGEISESRIEESYQRIKNLKSTIHYHNQ